MCVCVCVCVCLNVSRLCDWDDIHMCLCDASFLQTGTGKTYTMEGVHNDEEKRGIIPRSIEEIFRCTHC
jgi:hypothetical protein